jgi:hypothetical protein
MDQQSELELKHREVSEKILSFKGKIAPSLTIETFGKILPGRLSSRSLLYWMLIVIILNLVIWIPGLLVSRILGEPTWDSVIWLGWFVGVQTCISGLLTSHFALQNVLGELATRVVNKITNIKDLDEFLQWIYSSWTPANIIGVVILYCGLWVIFGVGGISSVRGEFVGFGPTVTAMIGGIFLGIAANYVIWLTFLSRKLATYSYDLNLVNPAHSEIINVLENMFNKHLYITAGYFGAAMLVISFIKLTSVIFPLILLGWLIIILQF